jgi:hypothetical protein
MNDLICRKHVCIGQYVTVSSRRIITGGERECGRGMRWNLKPLMYSIEMQAGNVDIYVLESRSDLILDSECRQA